MDIPDRHLKRIGNLILGHPLKVKQFDNLFLTLVQKRYIVVQPFLLPLQRHKLPHNFFSRVPIHTVHSSLIVERDVERFVRSMTSRAAALPIPVGQGQCLDHFIF